MNNGKKLANLIAILHGIWTLWFIASLPLIIFFDSYVYILLAGSFLTILSIFIYGDCPFIIWENKLRKKYDPENFYETPFISHYIKKFIGINVSKNIVRMVRTIYIVILLGIVIFYK